MTLMDQREAAITELRTIKTEAKGADFSLEQSGRIEELGEQIKGIDLQVKAATTAERLLDAIHDDAPAGDADEVEAKSVGELFVKSAGYGSIERGSYGSKTDVKAATDIHTLVDLGEAGERAAGIRDLGIQRLPDQRTSLFGWLRPQPIAEAAVRWVQETAPEGAFEIVPEGGTKPQIHFGYEPKSDTLHTAAGWFDSTVQQVRRAPAFAGDINRRGVRKLILDQERMVISGEEESEGFDGLLNTSGIGTVTATADSWFESLYEAIMQAEELGEFPVDGMLMNRHDWGRLRLARDENGNFLGGSPFAGEVAERLFTIPVIVSPRLARGTAVVGASQNAAVYTEETVHVDVTNSDGDKFRKNIVTTRVEQDVLFTAIRPAGFVKVTLTQPTP